jgi:hypothetical protein
MVQIFRRPLPLAGGSGAVVHNLTINVSAPSGAGIVRSAGKVISPVQASTAGLIRSTKHLISVAQGSAAAAIRSIGKLMLFSLASTTTLKRSSGKVAVVNQGSAISVARAIGKGVAVGLASAVSIVRAVGHAMAVSVGDTVTLSPKKSGARIISISSPVNAALVRSTAKGLSISLAQAVRVPRAMSKFVSVLAPQSFNLLRSTAHIITITPAALSASVVRTAKKIIAASSPAVVSLTQMRSFNRVLSPTLGQSISISRSIAKIINVSTSFSQEVSSSGNTSIPVPAGALTAQIEAIGTGAGTPDAGASAGGGAYSQTIASPLSGVTSLFVSIATQTVGVDETATKVTRNNKDGTVVCLANGGHSGSAGGGPGAGGSISGAVGDITFAGGSGDGTDAGLSWAGGGAGGPNGNGGNAAGNTPGLGGGGKAGNGGTNNNVGQSFGGGGGSGGTTGGVGWVKITWTFGPGVPAIAGMIRVIGRSIAAPQASSITLVKAIGRSVAVTLADVVSLIPIRNRPKTMSASSPVTATLVRTSGKVITVTDGFSVTLARNIGRFVTVAQGASVSTRFAISKAIAFAATTASSLIQFRAFSHPIQTSQSSSVSMVRSTGKVVASGTAQSVAVQRSIAHTIALGLSQAVSVVRSTSRAISAAVAPAASMARGVGKVIAPAQPSSVSIGRSVAKFIRVLQPQSVSVSKQQSRTMTIGLPHILTLILPVVRSTVISVSLGQSVTLARNVGKLIAVGVSSAVSLFRRLLRDSSGATEPALIRSGNNIFLVTIQGHDGTSVKTLRFSTDGIMTRPTDTPANTYYDPRVIDPGNFERHLFSSGTTRGGITVSGGDPTLTASTRSGVTGGVSVGGGDVVLASADSGRNGDTLDYLLSWAFDGYRIVIQSLTTVRQAVSLAKTLFTGTIEQIVTDNAYDKMAFKIHDRLADLNLALLQNAFGGTTTAGGMGTADGDVNLAGQKKQKLWGTNFNITPQTANAFDLVYLFSDGPVSSIVAYDGGVLLTNDGDVADLATLLTWTQVGGHYQTCYALGLIRLGTVPTFGLTADVTEGASSADRTAGQIANRILLSFGISAGDIGSASITALDAKNSAECGLLVSSAETCLASVTLVLDSIGAWIVPDRNGVFQVGRFEAPTGTPVVSLDEDTIIGSSLQRIATGDDGRGIPPWRVTVNYAFNNTIQKDTQLAGAVTATRRVLLAATSLPSAAFDLSVKTRHLSAIEVTVDSCMAYAADAAIEAQRLLDLHKVRRDAYRVDAMLDYGDAADLGTVVQLTSSRFGLSTGQLFVVIGRVDNYEGKTIQLDLWGPGLPSGQPMGLLLTLTGK